jgi:hypothetical protein
MKNLKFLLLIVVIFSTNQVYAQNWLLSGNSLTSTQFLGSTNNADVIFKRWGQRAGLLGSSNTSWGVGALDPLGGGGQTGTGNTAIGFVALSGNGSGSNNVAVGQYALSGNTAGGANVANGFMALASNTSGGANVANGFYALAVNGSGNYNVANGYQALLYNTNNANVATGYQSMYSNSLGGFNTATATQSLFSNTSGNSNTADGYATLYTNSTGNNNAAFGNAALYTNLGGTYNTAIGSDADVSSGNLTNATAIGAYAKVGSNNSIVLGGTGAHAVNVGVGTPTPNASALLDLTSTTQGLLFPRVTTTQKNAIATPAAGLQVYDNTVNQPSYYNGTAWVNLGSGSGWSLTGNAGTIPGTGAGQNFMGTTDDKDVVFARNGIQAGLLNNSLYNTSWGVGALNPSTTGIQNTAAGYYALQANTLGTQNVANGDRALYTNTTGGRNVGIGEYSLYLNTTGTSNIGVGAQALASNVTGYGNIGIGDVADVASSNLNNSIAIGYNASVSTSNTIQLGNSLTTALHCAVTVITTSDGRFKKNIKENVPGLDFIKQLKPVTYNYDVRGLDKHMRPNAKSDSGERQQINEASIVSKEKIRYTGFIAQDVEIAANKLGFDFSGVHKPQNDNDTYGLGYSEFVVPLVKAVQELSTQNDSLKEGIVQQQEINNNLQQQLNDLKTTIAKMQTAMSQCCNSYSSNMATATLKPQAITGNDAAVLQQNTPNPYNSSAVIAYHLPQSTTNAEIIVTDLSGNVLKSISLNGNGDGQVTFSAGSFASGTYFYTLLINGQKIDTKEMIIAK